MTGKVYKSFPGSAKAVEIDVNLPGSENELPSLVEEPPLVGCQHNDEKL